MLPVGYPREPKIWPVAILPYEDDRPGPARQGPYQHCVDGAFYGAFWVSVDGSGSWGASGCMADATDADGSTSHFWAVVGCG